MSDGPFPPTGGPKFPWDYIEGMKARGARLVFASDHSISTNTEYQSYLYGLQVYREHMMIV